MEQTKLKTIREEAKGYESPVTKNIAELDLVEVDLPMEDREGTNKETNEKFKYKVIVINGEDYRVPWVVIRDLQAILERKPDLRTFSVSKKGEGMQTRYTVIPLA